MWIIILLAFTTASVEAVCTGHQQHQSVYSFVTPDDKRAWDLHRWFLQAAQGISRLQELSVHTSKVGNKYGVQVKLCPEESNADVRFRCAFRGLANTHRFLPNLSNFPEDSFTYRPLKSAPMQVIPLRTGQDTAKGDNGWGTLLFPMTYEAGVNSVVCAYPE